jgi:hypothetical protein
VVAAAGLVLVSAATDWPSRTATATVETTAPVDAVWAILTDFEAYSEWNPFITSASGSAGKGEEIELRIAPPGEAVDDVTAEIVILQPGRKLRWQSRLVAPGVRDREYEFLIGVAAPGSLIVAGTARHEGVLVPLSSFEGVEDGVELMLEALVRRAEATQR